MLQLTDAADVLLPENSNGQGNILILLFSHFRWQPGPHDELKLLRRERELHNLVCWSLQLFNNKTQLYSGYTASTAVWERLSLLLYNRLLTFQIQIDLFEYSNKAGFSPSENFRRVCIKGKVLSAQITQLHNENSAHMLSWRRQSSCCSPR